MAKHKYNKLLSRLLREIVKLSQTLTRQTLRWLWRSFFVANRRRQNQAGFVLPTVAMMLMVVALVVGAIMFRTFTQTNRVIQSNQELLNDNSAAPAIERAKAKLEYLFNDPRLQSGVPDESVLEALILNDGSKGFDSLTTSPYQLPDEQPVTLDVKAEDMGGKTTAWKFETDKNGNGKTDDPEDLVTYYAIVTRSERNNYTIDPEAVKENKDLTYVDDEAKNDTKKTSQIKADNFIVRNGPLVSLTGNTNPLCKVQVGGNPVGWFNSSSTSYVFKSFQVYAITLPKAVSDGASKSASGINTLQYQQDRAFEKGNKWGAWFRYDLEIAPGPAFNWNGSMHTQGNMFLRGFTGFRSYLISSPNSCFFDLPSNSVLSLRSDQQTEKTPNARGGQLVSGWLRGNEYIDTKVTIDTYAETPLLIALTQNTQQKEKSSVQMVSGGKPIDVSTNPLELHVRGISQPKNNDSWTDNVKWKESDLSAGKNPRVKQAASCAPYVDDTYRADNRFGPKPTYSREIYDQVTGRCEAPAEGTIGAEITAPTVSANRVTELTGDEPPANDKEGEKVGLDGYWERRARFKGLRVIVGQRLELGNPFGWYLDRDSANGAERDLYPLVPPIPATAVAGSTDKLPGWADTGTTTTSRRNEALQYTTLRDNLAAVQATAVYHYTNEGGYFPIAFVATTAHPGTTKTIEDSTLFRKPAAAFKTKTIPAPSTLFGTDFGDSSSNNEILTNFFIGEGTNGWEFNVVPGPAGTPQTEDEFKKAIAADKPLRRALTNLAYFAGDPDGYFPPKQEASDKTTIHPYANLTMWGNFSNLRETIRRLDAGTTYDKLSIADKSNLHTAAGALGMLAYNISYLQDYDYTLNSADLITLNEELGKVSTSSPPSGYGKVTDNGSTVTVILPGDTTALPEQPVSLRSDAYIAALPETTAAQKKIKELARLIHLKEQANRDRTSGFDQMNNPCAIPTALTNARKLCPQGPKFPSLFYLFPKYNHDHQGKPATGVIGATPVLQPTGLTGEPYVTDTYIYEATSPPKGVNKDSTYKVLEDNDSNGVEDGTGALTDNGIAKIALLPRAKADWKLPKVDDATGSNTITDKTTNAGASAPNLSVPFLDKGIFDGRQMLGVRVLDVDLDLLRKNTIKVGSISDTWLPTSSLVYAFREDAMREDGIARPVMANKTWADYSTAYSSNASTAANVMDLWNATGPKDPPQCLIDLKTNECQVKAPERGISPKPVDFYADPDRRPHGFRLRKGVNLRREPQNEDNKFSGLSFISDNPVYIHGDFNPHSENANPNSPIEEFKLPLDGSWSNFYTRTELNPSFARPATDTWRPAEIISDAVTVLSNSFCDGTIQGGIRGNNNGCAGSSNASYRNSHMKGDPGNIVGTATAPQGYICENPFDPKTATVQVAGTTVQLAGTDRRGCAGPIKVFRNGEIKYYKGTTSADITPYTNYGNFTDAAQRPSLNSATDTRVNAVIVSGIVPSQQNQSNGGMVNFPRFIENWNGKNLRFSGAMMQLGFSVYGTAPWDVDAWEPGSAPKPEERIPYYYPPNRQWGYDVGLQYAPPAPVAKRMVSPAKERTEFYREPEADDAYICKLRKAANYPCQ